MTVTNRRKELLDRLIKFSTPLASLRNDLKQFPYDSEQELAVLLRDDVISILRRYVSGELSSDQLEEWANLMEGRDDIGFEPGSEDLLSKVMFELANPVLAGGLDIDNAQSRIHALKGSAK